MKRDSVDRTKKKAENWSIQVLDGGMRKKIDEENRKQDNE